MVTKERTAVKITDVHRRAMRRITLKRLEKAYRELHDGRSEITVCIDLKVSPEVFEGVLRPALIEALWERGHSYFIHELAPVELYAI